MPTPAARTASGKGRTRQSKPAAPRTAVRAEPAPATSSSGLSIEGIPFELPRATAKERARAAELLADLDRFYPDAHCELVHSNAHELLVATILSAQATDAGVNKATPALFARFPTPADYAAASPAEIEPYIRTIGLYRNKAKAVHAAMTEIVTRFGGEVPRTMQELLTLRGVARKTANVVLSNAYGVHVGVVVDTHVERLSKRLGLAPGEMTIPMIERRLMALFPRERWGDISHLLIFHGRRACKARGVSCGDGSGHPICERFGATCECRVKPDRRSR